MTEFQRNQSTTFIRQCTCNDSMLYPLRLKQCLMSNETDLKFYWQKLSEADELSHLASNLGHVTNWCQLRPTVSASETTSEFSFTSTRYWNTLYRNRRELQKCKTLGQVRGEVIVCCARRECVGWAHRWSTLPSSLASAVLFNSKNTLLNLKRDKFHFRRVKDNERTDCLHFTCSQSHLSSEPRKGFFFLHSIICSFGFPYSEQKPQKYFPS